MPLQKTRAGFRSLRESRSAVFSSKSASLHLQSELWLLWLEPRGKRRGCGGFQMQWLPKSQRLSGAVLMAVGDSRLQLTIFPVS